MKALITGICGQDGSYLAELLLDKGYAVDGFTRVGETSLPEPLRGRVTLHIGTLASKNDIDALVVETRPDEIYHLAGQTQVHASFEIPEQTADITAMGTLRMLEAVRLHAPEAKFFYASTSEMFGQRNPLPVGETAKLDPLSPYAVSKVFGYNMTAVYRSAHKLFACTGILFNHESPRRGEGFVTQKIACAAARIAAGLETSLTLGNLDSRRDWGFAGDYVEAMWRMLQADQPDDYVIATGVSHSVRDFCEVAFRHVGLDYRDHVVSDPALVRAVDVSETRGDASKARQRLGWTPQVSFEQLVHAMVDAQRQRLEEQQ
jgi:GDPmannose 4,6-dehydratase